MMKAAHIFRMSLNLTMHMVPNAKKLAADEYVPWKAKNLHKSYINIDINE